MVEPDLSLRFRQNQYPWAFSRGAGINKNAGVEIYFPGIRLRERGEDNPPSPPFEGLSLARPLAAPPVTRPQRVTTKWKPLHIRLQLSCESLHSAQHRAHFTADTARCHHWIALTFTKSFSTGTLYIGCVCARAAIAVCVWQMPHACASLETSVTDAPNLPVIAF